MMTQNNAKKTHDMDTKYMRIIASFFVVVLHSSGLNSTAAIFINSISRFSVPVFVIISGYYMLEKKKELCQITDKCIGLLLKMLVWSGIYYVYGLLCGDHHYVGVRELVRYLLTEPVHLWYCYASIALYLFTPVLYVFCKHASKEEYHYALFLTFTLGTIVVLLIRSNIVPILQVVVDKMKIPYILGFVCLYLFGGYMKNHGFASKSHRIILYLLGIAGTAVSFAGALFSPAWNLPNDFFLSFFAPNTVLAGAAFFVFVQQFYRDHPNILRKIQPIICRISECTLGIYLLHPLILMILQRVCVLSSPCLLIAQKSILTYLISLIIVFLVKRVPAFKRLV